MPIKADYTWTEKKDTVKVVIPLKGVSASKVDVFGRSLHTYCMTSSFLIRFLLMRSVCVDIEGQLLAIHSGHRSIQGGRFRET